MSKIVLDQFGGIAPAVNPRKLADQIGQEANNVYLKHRTLAPYPDTTVSAVTGFAPTATWAYLYEKNATTTSFITTTGGIAHYAKPPIANDTKYRLVNTSSILYPRIYGDDGVGGSDIYRLGIPAPAAASVTSFTAPGSPNDIDAETIVYVVTLVDAWGAEGPPSPPTTLTDREIDTDVTLTLPAVPTPASGSYNFGTGALFRLYRSNAGTSSTAYQFTKEFPIADAQATVTDDTVNALLGEVIPTTDWIGPPDDDATLYPDGPMLGICNLPNGVMAGFSGTQVCLSEPFAYHAWPGAYRISVPDEIVGITAIAQGLVVATKRKPYLLTGVDPGAMTLMELDTLQSCVSQRSLVDMGEYAIYASPDGLVLINGTRANVITSDIFTRAQWNSDWQPEDLHANNWEGYYIAFNQPLGKGFLFSIENGDPNFVTFDIGDVYGSYYDAYTDQLYVNGASVLAGARVWGRAFSSFLNSNLTWQSKEFVLPRPECMTVCRVNYEKDPASFPITVTVYGDGVQITQQIIQTTSNAYTNDQDWFRLPESGRHRTYSVKVETANEVTRVTLASAMQELA